MDVDGYEYRLIRRWIEQGMPYGQASRPDRRWASSACPTAG